MSPRVLQLARRTAALAVVAGAATVTLLLSASGSATAEPDPNEQLDKAAQQLEVITEKYNDAREELKETRSKAAKLTQQLAPLQAKVDALQRRIGLFASAAYKGSKASAVNAILESGSPSTMADQLLMLDRIAAGNNREVSKLNEAKSTLDAEKSKLDKLIAQQTKQEQDIANQKKTIEKEVKRLERLTGRGDGGGGPYPDAPYVAGKAGVIVKFAYDQLGKWYEFGSAGPNTFDCSGLVLAAHRKLGITLPHSARKQWARRTPVSRGALQPGDAVWFYSDLHHVGIYVGNGKMIHAPQTGKRIQIASISGRPFQGGGRLY